MSGQSWWGSYLLEQGTADLAVWSSPTGMITLGRLRTEVAAMAEMLAAHGIQAGSTVAVQGVPSFTQIWSVLSLWSRGCQVLMLEQGLSAEDRASLLRTCRPQFLITFGGYPCRAGQFLDECEVLVRPLIDGHPARSSHCVVQFSSGTTGPIKVVGRNSESLLVELDRLQELPDMPQQGERVAVLESLGHSFSLIGGLLHALNVGATVAFPRSQDAHELARAVIGSHAVVGNPRAFARLLTTGEHQSQMRLAVSVGEALHRNVFDAFADRYGVRIGQAYGTTETGLIACDLTGRFGTPVIGLPLAGVRTRVVAGVLEVHVPHTPYLYADHPWYGGWMSTHDMVSVDADTGAIRLRGRVEPSDTIDPGAVDLLEVESVLLNHEHVLEAVVLGGRPIEAHISGTAQLDLRQLEIWCARRLGSRSQAIRYHLFSQLPRSSGGKAVRRRISPCDRDAYRMTGS